MTLRALSILMLSAPAAWAQDNPIRGTYGDANGCLQSAGQADANEPGFILTPHLIERSDTTCPIRRLVENLDGELAKAEVACLGGNDGYWIETYRFAPLPGEDGYIIDRADDPAFRVEVRRCG